jgi:F-type H+-transporting ATPase subunit epsilon
MSDTTLLLTILTQERELVTQPVRSLSVMTQQGELTILPGHIPLLSRLADGELVYRWNEGGKEQKAFFAVSGGFMDVGSNGEVTVLADHAVRSEDINEAKAQEARKAAEEAMANKQSVRDFKLAEASLRQALTELRVAEKRRGNSGMPRI